MKRFRYFCILVVLISGCATNQTNTPLPSKIPATKTLIPSPVPTSTAVSLRACVTNETIRVRSGAGTQFEVIGGLTSGTCMSILGRNQDSSWVYITADENTRGWVAGWLLTIEGDVEQVAIKSQTDIANVASTVTIKPTSTIVPILPPTSVPATVWINPFVATSTVADSIINCSQTRNKIGEYTSCKIQRAYCDYLPSTNGSPTFCDDRPYPNQNFQLVVFGEDWSDYDGYCIVVSGTVSLYGGVPQILATSRSQVSYCQ